MNLIHLMALKKSSSISDKHNCHDMYCACSKNCYFIVVYIVAVYLAIGHK